MAKGLGQIKVDAIKQGLKDETRIKELEDMNLALTNENEELETKLNKWIKMQEKGYTAVAINDGLIVHAVQVLPYSKFTYTQDIPREIGTSLYRSIPFYKLDSNGKMIKDIQQYNRYISI